MVPNEMASKALISLITGMSCGLSIDNELMAAV
jgi:hypothetical protein